MDAVGGYFKFRVSVATILTITNHAAGSFNWLIAECHIKPFSPPEIDTLHLFTIMMKLILLVSLKVCLHIMFQWCQDYVYGKRGCSSTLQKLITRNLHCLIFLYALVISLKSCVSDNLITDWLCQFLLDLLSQPKTY